MDLWSVNSGSDSSWAHNWPQLEGLFFKSHSCDMNNQQSTINMNLVIFCHSSFISDTHQMHTSRMHTFLAKKKKTEKKNSAPLIHARLFNCIEHVICAFQITFSYSVTSLLPALNKHKLLWNQVYPSTVGENDGPLFKPIGDENDRMME